MASIYSVLLPLCVLHCVIGVSAAEEYPCLSGSCDPYACAPPTGCSNNVCVIEPDRIRESGSPCQYRDNGGGSGICDGVSPLCPDSGSSPSPPPPPSNKPKQQKWIGDPQYIGRTQFTPFYFYSPCSSKTKCDSNDKIGAYFDRLGLEILLEDIPDNPSTNALHKVIDCETNEVTLYTNSEERVFEYPSINKNKFKHLYLNWNPEGHTPPGVYDVPHMDWHFYFIDSTAREATAQSPACDADRCQTDILEEVDCDNLARCNTPTIDPDRFFPGGSGSDWFCVACVPAMGIHCLDPEAATEVTQGEKFDDTFFMTRWDGVLNSNEPMVTIEAFQTLDEGVRAEKCVTFRTPNEYMYGDGCYPSAYCYGCGKETEFGVDKCWVYLTDYTYKSQRGDKPDRKPSKLVEMSASDNRQSEMAQLKADIARYKQEDNAEAVKQSKFKLQALKKGKRAAL